MSCLVNMVGTHCRKHHFPIFNPLAQHTSYSQARFARESWILRSGEIMSTFLTRPQFYHALEYMSGFVSVDLQQFPQVDMSESPG